MLDRIHLSIVQEVEKQGSLTAAAGVLHVTQSALSHSMKKLEQQLSEERSARINLQSRAAAAEAKAAKMEGELQAMQNQKPSRGFLDRLRGG